MSTTSFSSPENGPSAAWLQGATPSATTIDQSRRPEDFALNVPGHSFEFPVAARQGDLDVRIRSDGTREISCPTCETGTGIVHQEWVYSFRELVRPTLQQVDDDRAGTLWFLTISMEGSPDGALDISGGPAAPFLCRACGKGYGLPEDIHVTFPW